jgi:hypothetical protein
VRGFEAGAAGHNCAGWTTVSGAQAMLDTRLHARAGRTVGRRNVHARAAEAGCWAISCVWAVEI